MKRESPLTILYELHSDRRLSAPHFVANRPEKKYNDTNGIAAYVGTTYVDL